jgi:hypothetical protein
LPNTSFTFDVEEANRLLDKSGWARDINAQHPATWHGIRYGA